MASSQNSRLFSFYLRAVRELGRALTEDAGQVESPRALRESLYRLLGTFAISRGALLLWDAERRRFMTSALKGFRFNQQFWTFSPQAKQLKILAQGVRPFHPEMPPGGLETFSHALGSKLSRFHVQWIVPLCTGTDFIGLVLLGPRLSGEPLNSVELEVLEEMALIVALRIKDTRARRRLDLQLRQLQ